MNGTETHHIGLLPAAPTFTRERTRNILLGFGAVAALVYVATDAIAALRFEGYNYLNQTISELSAIGSPTRTFWMPLGFLYSVLVLAGAAGVWLAAGRSRPLRAIAVLEGCMGVIGLLGWPLAPMHERAVLAAGGATFSDTMHLVFGGVDTLIFFLCIALGARAFGKRFQLYSVVTIAVLLVFGAFTGLDASGVQHDQPTPWLGVTERLTVFGSMLWLSVLSLRLMDNRGRTGSETR